MLAIALIITSCTQNKTKSVANSTNTIEIAKIENGAEADSTMLNTILEQLNLDYEDCYSEFILQELVPGKDNLMIWVIPRIAYLDEVESKNFDLDGYIVLADKETGKIIGKNYSSSKWVSDAYMLNIIYIDTLNYHLNDDEVVFGVGWSHSGSSRVSPAGARIIELFTQKGDSLNSIFKYHVSNYHGDNDGGNKGYSRVEEYNTKLIVLDKKTDSFSDFVLLTERQSEYNENNELVESSISNDSLRFFRYEINRYVEVEERPDVFCKPVGFKKKDCVFYNKTLPEVYQIIYRENNDNLQQYMRIELPLSNVNYSIKSNETNGEIDSIDVSYIYENKHQLTILFSNNFGGAYYIFEEKGDCTTFKYDYHD